MIYILLKKLFAKRNKKSEKRPIDICPEAVAYLTNPRDD